jgi:hypothetical protein
MPGENMPFIYNGIREIENKPRVGDGGCVTLIKTLTPGLQGLSTSAWRKGATVVGSTGLLPGTAIATFENGRYPGRSSGNHAAFFLAYGGAGIWVIDQWAHETKTKVERRFIHPARPRKDGTFADPSNSAQAFSVIELR